MSNNAAQQRRRRARKRRGITLPANQPKYRPAGRLLSPYNLAKRKPKRRAAR